MSDEKAALAQRLESIRISAGLPAFADSSAVVEAMNRAGVTVWFHGTVADNDVADKLHQLHSRQPGLFMVPDRPVNASNAPATVQHLVGKLDWGKLSPVTKLQFANEAAAQRANQPRSAATSTTAAMRAMPAAQRLAGTDAAREIARLESELTGLRMSRGGGVNVQSVRAGMIGKIESRLAALRDRFGLVAA